MLTTEVRSEELGGRSEELVRSEEGGVRSEEDQVGLRGRFGGMAAAYWEHVGEIPAARDGVEAPGRGDGGAEKFWEGLGAAEREGLRVILREGGAAELEGWARRQGTMAELFIDGINEKFLGVFGDLLVETVDEGPRIQAEYKEDVKKILGEP
jgi:hypothetical protein